MTSHHDLERAISYALIPTEPTTECRRSNKSWTGIVFSSFVLSLFLIILFNHNINTTNTSRSELVHSTSTTSSISMSLENSTLPENQSRGVPHGVSEKSFRRRFNGKEGLVSFSWTNDMLTWQRTGYHFQPVKNWMNDPNGPLFYKGWYHLFYQYNPDSAVWGNITWGHTVSRDLIHWLYLPIAMVPDQWYDFNGVWTGSATLLPNGQIIMLYTGSTKDDAQVQCLAYPANSSDPLLLEWTKDRHNPILSPPPGIRYDDFRDPTTAWLISPDGEKWRITVGSKVNKTGFSLVYETSDFIHYELLKGLLHEVPGTGMWECIDFYPVSLTNGNGLDTSANGPGIKHVLKIGVQDELNDYYAIGTYDPINNKWMPDDPSLDIGAGLRYDYGKYYASKSFYDEEKQRRILLSWVKESNGEDLDILKGWSGVQSIPRTIVYDQKTGSNLLQWPIKEVESLRSESYEFNDIKLGPGSVVPLKMNSTSQLDIFASFQIERGLFESVAGSDSDFDCTTSGGSANRGMFGPFGILVLADETLSELTPIYFYIAKGANGKVETHFCADELRSSEASNVEKVVYGSKVPVLDGERLSIRSLVDHSIVESFAQEGRSVITSRVYPTKAINGAARVYLFNNATGFSVTASVKAWEMDSADIHHFPLDQI